MTKHFGQLYEAQYPKNFPGKCVIIMRFPDIEADNVVLVIKYENTEVHCPLGRGKFNDQMKEWHEEFAGVFLDPYQRVFGIYVNFKTSLR